MADTPPACNHVRAVTSPPTPHPQLPTAWDCWENGDTPAVYLNHTLAMLGELMDREKYGKIDRLWFDQWGWGDRNSEQSPSGLWPASWGTITDYVHAHSPGTAMLPGPDGCLTFGEGGAGAYPVVSYVNDTRLCSYACPAGADDEGLGCWSNASFQPDPRGNHFMPYVRTRTSPIILPSW